MGRSGLSVSLNPKSQIPNRKSQICRSSLPSTPQLESRDSMSSSDTEETRGRLVRSASAITPLTLVSRLTGYLREKVVALLLLAWMFGVAVVGARERTSSGG